MRTLLVLTLVLCLFVTCLPPTYAQQPQPGPVIFGAGGSSGGGTPPDYIIVSPGSPYVLKPNATSTYWQTTLVANVAVAPTLTTTGAPNGELVGWRIVQGGSGSYSFTWPALVLNAPTIDGTFCNAVGDVMVATGVWNGTNVLISASGCVPATPGVAAFQDATGIKTFASGTFTISAGGTTEPANYAFICSSMNCIGDYSGSMSLTANQPVTVPIFSFETQTITKAAINITTSQAASLVYYAIYDAACTTKLVQGSVAGTSTGAKTITLSPTVLNQGRYVALFASDVTGVVVSASDTGAPVYNNVGAGTNKYLGTTANTLSGSTMPATCGTITTAGAVKIPFYFLTN